MMTLVAKPNISYRFINRKENSVDNRYNHRQGKASAKSLARQAAIT